jgi:hypothetical protein
MKKVVKLTESDLSRIVNRVLNESHEDYSDRYMFFSNLEQMRRQCDMLLELDQDMVTEILDDGHDWAQDHIAEAKNNMDQVFDFMMNHTKGDGKQDIEDSSLVVSESKLNFIIGKPISLIKRLHTSKYNPESGKLEKIRKDVEISGEIVKIKNDDPFSVPEMVVKCPDTVCNIMFEESKNRFIEGESSFSYEYIPVSDRDSRILNLFKNNYYESDEETLQEGKKKTGTKLCARGKAAAKSKFKVYPSAYGNGFAVQVCQGRMKGLDGKKKCSPPYC